MVSFKRLMRFVWPFRGRLFVSIAFGLLVAMFWGLNLSATMPIVKVLLEGESLQEYVATKLVEAGQEAASRSASVEHIDKQLAELPPESSKRVKLLEERARNESKLAAATAKVAGLERLQVYVLPWLPTNQFKTFAFILALLLVATALKGICIFVQDVLVGSVVELAVMNVRKQCFEKVLTLDYQSLAQGGTGDLMSRFTYDTQLMSDGMSLMGGKLVREPLKAVSCVALAMYINWRLTLLSMIFVPLLGLAFHHYGRMLKRASKRMMESMSRIYKVLEETFEGLKVVIAFDTAKRHQKQFSDEYEIYYKKAMKVVRIDALTKPTSELLGLCAVCIAMLPGAYLVLRGDTDIWGIKLASDRIDIAELAWLYAVLAGLLDPCRKLSNVYSRLKRATAATDRIFELMDKEPLVREVAQPKTMPRHHESIVFEDVTFSYQTRQDSPRRGVVLDGVNLNVPFGEVVAIVGENGCGKSTLLSLLPRFFDPERGQVLIDAQPIHELALSDLRGQIGLVTQDTILFDDTIYENICYGRPGATREEIEAAADQARVTDFIAHMPQGFDTVVGEKGKELSGGQRQRVALARAILRNPPILILDEATSATDGQSEFLIHQALETFVAGRTTLMITHTVSESLLRFVDRFIVMERGKIAADGTHAALIETCPIYQKLFQGPARKQAA